MHKENKTNMIKPLIALALCLNLIACNPSTDPANSEQIKQSANTSDEGWPLNGRDYDDQHYSPLADINDGNIAQLGLQWHIDLPNEGGQEATPIVIGSTMYFTTPWSVVYAVDATKGDVLWMYDPKVPPEVLVKACCGPVNRGVAYLDGFVYSATLDGRLIALDASNGTLAWETMTVDQNDNYTITGAPRVANGLVYIGNGGGEYAVRGYMSAYDAKTGGMAWRFYTVPGDPSKPFENPILEKAAKTWHGRWWEVGGGGTVWDSMSYDPETNLLYIGVGNSSPYSPLARTDGKGDNLFVSSIVAVDASTGEYRWHYQTTPGDSWDYTATQNMIFAELEIKGENRKVIMQAPKNGFFYVLDRQTGELLSAETYVTVNWSSGIDMTTGRPTITDEAKYWLRDEPTMIWPSAYGGHNWKPMAYSPDTQLVYIPASDAAIPIAANPNFKKVPIGRNTGLATGGTIKATPPAVKQQLTKVYKGLLLAWDPVKQEAAWSAPTERMANGGVLATAGNLVFMGTSSGYFRAYNAVNGEQLWQFDAQDHVMAAPISYRIDGKQYIAVMAGRGGAVGRSMAGLLAMPDNPNRSRLLVFALDGEQALEEPKEDWRDLPHMDEIAIDEDKALLGSAKYGHLCASCHGLEALGGGVVPDLRYSPFTLSKDAYYQVVNEGILASKGMVSFDQVLDAEGTEAIRQYVIAMNQEARRNGELRRHGR